ncbi:hypothetical protein BDK51DRAFT_33878, partial [Blyttiomyces helicus]
MTAKEWFSLSEGEDITNTKKGIPKMDGGAELEKEGPFGGRYMDIDGGEVGCGTEGSRLGEKGTQGAEFEDQDDDGVLLLPLKRRYSTFAPDAAAADDDDDDDDFIAASELNSSSSEDSQDEEEEGKDQGDGGAFWASAIIRKGGSRPGFMKATADFVTGLFARAPAKVESLVKERGSRGVQPDKRIRRERRSLPQLRTVVRTEHRSHPHGPARPPAEPEVFEAVLEGRKNAVPARQGKRGKKGHRSSVAEKDFAVRKQRIESRRAARAIAAAVNPAMVFPAIAVASNHGIASAAFPAIAAAANPPIGTTLMFATASFPPPPPPPPTLIPPAVALGNMGVGAQ